MESKKLFEKVTSWTQQEKNIRAVLLTGSHAEKRETDELSDHDIALFCRDNSAYAGNDAWPASIEKVWATQYNKIKLFNKKYPTRLVIFKDGLKVDFTLFPMEFLHDMVVNEYLPDEFNIGYEVLLDKDALAKNLLKPTYEGFKVEKPTEETFKATVESFWFEVYYVAKYLARGDLWSVKFVDCLIKKTLLLKMIEWNQGAKNNWDYMTSPIGKRMHTWVDQETWERLHKTFAHFDEQDSWQALLETMELFRQLAQQTAQLSGLTYPEDVDKNITSFVLTLKKK